MRTRTSQLIVNHEPTIVKSAELSKYAVERGHPAYLTCRAVYVPGEAEFAWFMESDVLSKKASSAVFERVIDVRIGNSSGPYHNIEILVFSGFIMYLKLSVLEGQSHGSKPRGDRLRDQAGWGHSQRLRLGPQAGQRAHGALRNALQVQYKRGIHKYYYFINIHNYFPTMDAYDIFIRNKFPTKSTFAREGAW